MKSLHTICYISNAAAQTSTRDIDQILVQASKKNNEVMISGILLYNLGHFFQVIEGEKKLILDLYENKIKNDSRHQDIYEVYNKATTAPVFLKYNSKFNIIKTEDDLQDIKKYLRTLHTTTSDKLTRLLKPFIVFQQI